VIAISIGLVIAVIAALSGKRFSTTVYTPTSMEERTFSLWPVVVCLAIMLAAAISYWAWLSHP
jgi:hypothetical protein